MTDKPLSVEEAEEFAEKGIFANFIAGRNIKGFSENMARQLADTMRASRKYVESMQAFADDGMPDNYMYWKEAERELNALLGISNEHPETVLVERHFPGGVVTLDERTEVSYKHPEAVTLNEGDVVLDKDGVLGEKGAVYTAGPEVTSEHSGKYDYNHPISPSWICIKGHSMEVVPPDAACPKCGNVTKTP